MTKTTYISQDLLDQLSMEAKVSPRRRKNYNFHKLSDPCQRMLNAIEPESYCQPHRHLNPPKDEGFLVIRGKGAVIEFDEEGHITQAHILDPKHCIGVDIPAGVFHTIVSLEPNTVYYESKTGPYDPNVDKDFASWAPQENQENTKNYLEMLKNEVKVVAE